MRLGLAFVFLVLSAALSTSAGALDLSGFKEKLNDLAEPSSSSKPAGSGLSQFSTQDQIESLRQALTQGAQTAVSNLAKKDGYLGNDKVRIPLPETCKKRTRPCTKSAWANIPTSWSLR